MSDLKGQPGELRMTIEVKRADTGEIDTYELIGTVVDESEDDNTSEPEGRAE